MRFWIVIFFCLQNILAQSQRLMLSGRIMDEITGAGIAGALISDFRHELGAVTNPQGFFTLSVPFDSCIFEVAAWGYKSGELRVKIRKDQAVFLKMVRAPQQRKNFFDPVFVIPAHQATVLHPGISLQEQKQLPQLLTNDFFRSTQYLPGFQQCIPGASTLHIRGMGYDRQGVYFDGAPLFNPYHFLGTVSVFDRINTAAVNFDKAGFDPGLSSGGGSTVQVRSKSVEGVNHSYMGIDPVFLKFGGELNLGKYGTLNGGLRKTYLAGLLKSLSDSFYVSPLVRDYFLKYTLNISKQQQLSASVLEATDQVESFERSGKKLDNGTPVTQDRFQQVGVRSMLWQAGLMQASKNGGWSEWQGYHSSYYFQNQLSLTTYLGQQQTLDQKSIRSYRMGMSESGLKFKKTTSPGYNRQFYWGGQVFYRFFRPGQRVNAQMAAGLPNTDTTYFNVTASVTELAGFIGSGRKYKQLGLLEYSSRVALLYASRIRAYIDPHISLTCKPDSLNTWIFSGDIMHQSYHLISRNNKAFGDDPVIPVNDKIKPFRMIQLDVSWQRKWSTAYRTDASIYYRNLGNDYIWNPSAPWLVSSNQYVNQLTIGKGNIYGAEFMFRKTTGLTTGWLSYGFILSNRVHKEINNGEVYSFYGERRHSVALMLINKIGKRNYFTLAFTVMSGNPVTAPLAKYQLPIAGNILNNWNGQFVGVSGGTNAIRTPWTHRLDLGYQLEKRSRWWRESSFNFSLYNVYNSLAIMDIRFRPANGNIKAGVIGTTVFPMLPTISYLVKF